MTTLANRLILPLHGLTSKVVDRLTRERAVVRAGLVRRDAYRQAFCRLQSLSDRELAANGVMRGDIANLAHTQAMSGTTG